MARFSTSITVAGYTAIASVPKGSRAYRKANSVFCPLGPCPTQAWFLLTRESVLAITASDTQAASAHTVVWTQVDKSYAETARLTFAGLYLVTAERVLHGGPDDDRALYLCEFADSRWLAEKRGDSDRITANIRSYANNSDYLTGTSGYTWSSLVEELWTDLSVLGSYPGLPGALPVDGVPQNTFLAGNGWRSLCAVLDQLDCAVAHHPLSNTYTIVQLGGSQTIPENESTLLWDGQPIGCNADCAETLRVRFFYHYKSYGQERDTELLNNWAWIGDSSYLDVATGIAGAGGRKTLWDDLPWILDENNTVSNGAALTARAASRNTRYASRHTVDQVHRLHIGLHSNFVCGGKVRAVLWRNWDDGEDQDAGGTVTEYVCRPELVTNLSGLTNSDPAWIDNGIHTPERENYLGNDLGRHSYPNYPRLANIVQVYHSTSDAGAAVAASVYGFHPGRIARWVANTMTNPGGGSVDCWIRFVDDHDNLEGNVDAINCDYYGPGRLSGVSTAGGTLLPVYTVRKGSNSGVPFFNDAGESAVPGAVMYIVNNVNTGGIPFLVIEKPGLDFDRQWLINNSTTVADQTTGRGSFLSEAGLAAVNGTDNSGVGSNIGESWGAKPNSWELWKCRPGFTAFSGPATYTVDGQLLCQFKQHVVNDLYGVFYDTLVKNGTALFSIQHRNTAGTFEDSGWDDITIRDFWLNTGDTVEATIKGKVHWYSGYWEVSNAYCEVPA